MRAPGEGSVYPRGDGKWVAQIEAGYNANGTRRYIRRVRATRREAYDALHELHRQTGDGIDSDLTGLTLTAYLDTWIDTLDLAPKTIRAYRCDIAHIVRHIGHVKVSDLAPQHVHVLLAAMRDDLSPKSRCNVRATLHGAIDQAVRERHVKWNPVSVVPPPRVPRHDVTVLTADEAQALIEHDGDRYHSIWQVMLSCGFRLGEALGLTWPRVDGDVIRIRHQLQRVDGEYVLRDLKSSGRVRDVPVTMFAQSALQRHRKAMAAEQLAADEWWGTFDLVWPSIVGRPLADTVPRNHLYDTTKDLLGRRVKPHTLRHTAATLMIARGVPLSMVSDVLGHASIQITKDFYGHLDVDQLRPAARALDDLFTR